MEYIYDAIEGGIGHDHQYLQGITQHWSEKSWKMLLAATFNNASYEIETKTQVVVVLSSTPQVV